MYKLLALDLDGTLLNDKSQIPADNLYYMKKALESGLKIFICSGRSYMSLLKFEEQFGLLDPGNYGAGFNGGMVYEADTRKVIRETLFNHNDAITLIKELRRFNADIIVYRGKTLYAEKDDGLVGEYAKHSEISVVKTDNLENIDTDVSKVLIKGDYETLKTAGAYISEIMKTRGNMFFSSPTLLEFTGEGATKGKALEFIADYLNIPIEECIAAGDNCNDISMIQAAGLGIAVKNATDETKGYADYITKTDNNAGVLKEIYESFICR